MKISENKTKFKLNFTAKGIMAHAPYISFCLRAESKYPVPGTEQVWLTRKEIEQSLIQTADRLHIRATAT